MTSSATDSSAQVVRRLPEGDEWIYDLKFDGYRALVIQDHERVEIRSRKNKDRTRMHPRLAAAGVSRTRSGHGAEIVALDRLGRPSFQALQHRGSHPVHRIADYAFDSCTSSAKNAGHHPMTGDDRRSIVTGSYRSACRTRTRH